MILALLMALIVVLILTILWFSFVKLPQIAEQARLEEERQRMRLEEIRERVRLEQEKRLQEIEAAKREREAAEERAKREQETKEAAKREREAKEREAELERERQAREKAEKELQEEKERIAREQWEREQRDKESIFDIDTRTPALTEPDIVVRDWDIEVSKNVLQNTEDLFIPEAHDDQPEYLILYKFDREVVSSSIGLTVSETKNSYKGNLMFTVVDLLRYGKCLNEPYSLGSTHNTNSDQRVPLYPSLQRIRFSEKDPRTGIVKNLADATFFLGDVVVVGKSPPKAAKAIDIVYYCVIAEPQSGTFVLHSQSPHKSADVEVVSLYFKRLFAGRLIRVYNRFAELIFDEQV